MHNSYIIYSLLFLLCQCSFKKDVYIKKGEAIEVVDYLDIPQKNSKQNNSLNFNSIIEKEKTLTLQKDKEFIIPTSHTIPYISSPTISNDQILFLDNTGILISYAKFDNNKGKFNWSYDIYQNLKNKNDLKYILGSINYIDNFILVTSNNKITVLSKEGKLIWENSISNIIRSKAVAIDNKVIAQTQDGIIYAWQLNNGDLLWTNSKFKTTNQVQKLHIKELLLIDKKLLAQNAKGEIYLVNIHNGNIIKEIKPDTYKNYLKTNQHVTSYSYFLIEDRILYFLFDNGSICAFDLDQQKIKWHKYFMVNNPFNIKNNLIYSIDEFNNLLAIDKNFGSLVWQINLNGKNVSALKEKLYLVSNILPFNSYWTTPLIVKDHIMIINSQGIIYLFKLNGDFYKKFAIKKHIYSTPTLDENYLYILSNDGKITKYSTKFIDEK